MSVCYCGEFDRPTIAPDEFGETCFHDLDKCEVPPTRIPDSTVIRVLRNRMLAAEAQVRAVRELCTDKRREVEESDPLFGPPLTLTVPDVLRALDGAE